MHKTKTQFSGRFRILPQWGVLFLLFLLSLTASSRSKTPIYKANHPAFHYMGRVDFSEPVVARYDWSGVEARFQFTGPELSIFFKGGERNFFNLEIDGKVIDVLHAASDTIVNIHGLAGTRPHKVRFFKRTEGNMGTAYFYGASPAPNNEIVPWQPAVQRRIEFIGNSITCGYGTEGANKEERFRPETENASKAYGTIISRALHADFHLIAHSGLGVVRNYGDEKKISTNEATLPGRYHQTLDTDPGSSWDFSSWQPHAVVINLGTNDFSTRPHPDKSIFQQHYDQLIEQVRTNYGQTPVFCLTGPMVGDPCTAYVEEMTRHRKTEKGDNNIYFLEIPANLLNTDDDLGSDWHPSYKGQQKMADYVLPLLKTVLDW